MRSWELHLRSYMAVRHHMLLQNFRVERIFIEFGKVALFLETHEDSKCVAFTIRIGDTTYE